MKLFIFPLCGTHTLSVKRTLQNIKTTETAINELHHESLEILKLIKSQKLKIRIFQDYLLL